jgi:hypothetical protein
VFYLLSPIFNKNSFSVTSTGALSALFVKHFLLLLLLLLFTYLFMSILLTLASSAL